jgi:hypothetical protein
MASVASNDLKLQPVRGLIDGIVRRKAVAVGAAVCALVLLWSAFKRRKSKAAISLPEVC